MIDRLITVIVLGVLIGFIAKPGYDVHGAREKSFTSRQTLSLDVKSVFAINLQWLVVLLPIRYGSNVVCKYRKQIRCRIAQRVRNRSK